MKIWHEYILFATVLISQSYPFCHVDVHVENDWIYDYDVDFNISDYFNEKSSIMCKNITTISDIHPHVNSQRHHKYLNITDSHISNIAPQAFDKFSTLTKLYLSNLHIKTISQGAFDNLTQLEELRLDYNEIEEVKSQIFSKLHRLKILNLRNNRIFKVDKEAFLGVDNLQVLNLRNNRITKIEKELVATQLHLRELDLSGNPIKDISLDNIFAYLNKLYLMETPLLENSFDISNLTLDILNMTHGQISKIDCAFLPRSRQLDLSNNLISTIINLKLLRALNVNFSNNKLQVIPGVFANTIGSIQISSNKLDTLESSFNKSKNLFNLDVSNNKISTIRRDAFEGLLSLSFLKLNNNNISAVETVWFRDLKKLTNLNLSHNSIKEFQFGTFDALSSLEILDVSYNKLTSLHQDTLHSLTSLSELYFDNNQISSLVVEDMKSSLRRLRRISLDKNKFSCQNLVKIERYLKFWAVNINHGTSYEGENFHGISCINNKEYDTSLSAKFLQKVINDSVRNSKFEVFFNNDFNKTKFAQFFDEGYSHSNFFKSLSESYNSSVLIFNTVVQMIVSLLLLALICFMYFYFKRIKISHRSDSSSLMELC